MRVCDNGRLSEDVSHDQVRALPSDARQGQQLLKCVRHVIPKFLMQHPHARGNIPRFARSKAAGPHDLLDLIRRGLRKGRHRRELFIELRRDLIHTRIRALSRKAHAHKKLPRLVVIQCALCLRIFLLQPPDHFQCQLLFLVKIPVVRFLSGLAPFMCLLSIDMPLAFRFLIQFLTCFPLTSALVGSIVTCGPFFVKMI